MKQLSTHHNRPRFFGRTHQFSLTRVARIKPVAMLPILGMCLLLQGQEGSGDAEASGLLVTKVRARAGQLDTTFGGTGKVTTPCAGLGATAVALQADGKIVVAGTGAGGDYAFQVVRYNTNGMLGAMCIHSASGTLWRLDGPFCMRWGGF